MKNLFIQLPFSVADASLPTIAPADIQLLSNPETDSLEHWLLGASDASLTGIKSGQLLTKQGSAQTYNAASIVLPGWGGALVSSIPDDLTSTVCAVIKRPVQSVSTDGVVAFGAFGSISSQKGSGLTIPNSTSMSTVQYDATPSASVVPWGSVAQGSYVFVAMAEQLDAASSPKQTLLYIGGGNKTTTASTTSRAASVARNLAFGNAAFDNASYKTVPLELCEAIVFNRPLTTAELDAVYFRSRVRMAGRGITI
ncbi:hypothetical protein ACU4HD_40805 [Cupriavidus basilensis]